MILKELRESPFKSNISHLHASKRPMTGLQYFGFILAAFLGHYLKVHVLGGTLKTLFSKCTVRLVLFVSYHCLLIYGFYSQRLRLSTNFVEQIHSCLDTLCRI